MEKFFKNLGRKLGSSVNKGKWYYKSFFGTEEDMIKAEYVMGKELAVNIRREMKILNDPSVQNLIDKIGGQLVKKVVNKQRKFEFNVFAASDINAFALPGGFIFITNALLNSVGRSKDEMAFVLSHEIMHVVLKHPLNRILADYSTQIVSNIVVRGGALGAIAKQALSNLLRSSYSRDNEFEADSYAVRLMYSADFNPLSAIICLESLKKDTDESLPIYNYFLSHPSLDERKEKIDSLIKQRKMIVT